MNGKEIFRKAVRVVVESAEQAIAEAGLTADRHRPRWFPTRPTCGSSAPPASASASPRRRRWSSSTATATPRRRRSPSPWPTPWTTGRLQAGPARPAHRVRRRHDVGQRRPALGRVRRGHGHLPCVRAWPPALARRYGGCKPLAPIGPRRRGRHRPAGQRRRRPPGSAGSCSSSIPRRDRPSATTSSGAGRRRSTWPSPPSGCRSGPCTPCWPPQAALGAGGSFGVANADDVYGESAMGAAGRPASRPTPTSTCSIGYQLRSTVATDDPVTRGICEVDADGLLVALTERRQVPGTDKGQGFAVRRRARAAGARR